MLDHGSYLIGRKFLNLEAFCEIFENFKNIFKKHFNGKIVEIKFFNFAKNARIPGLIFRQLPMIAAMLQGRSLFTFGEMKNRNHLLLYTHILGVLELLQPYVFHVEYHKPLEDIFDSYFTLLKVLSIIACQQCLEWLDMIISFLV